jgi:hypothetical protein
MAEGGYASAVTAMAVYALGVVVVPLCMFCFLFFVWNTVKLQMAIFKIPG